MRKIDILPQQRDETNPGTELEMELDSILRPVVNNKFNPLYWKVIDEVRLPVTHSLILDQTRNSLANDF